MSKHYDSSSLMQRWYWYIIPSLYAKFFYLRMTADFLTFSFVDSFIKESLNKEARMRELMNEGDDPITVHELTGLHDPRG